VTSEHAARTVGAVGGGGQPDDQDRRFDGPERGHRPSPVDLLGEGGPLLRRRLALSPFHESGTQPALRQAGVERQPSSRAATVTSEVAFHSIHPMPNSSATSIWARTWLGV